MRIKELAMSRIRFGYQRIAVLFRREGWEVGKKLVYRLYREQGLQVRTKRRRKKLASQSRGTLELAKASNVQVYGIRQSSLPTALVSLSVRKEPRQKKERCRWR